MASTRNFCMNLFEFLKNNFLDSCSRSKHNLQHRRKLINLFKKHLKNFDEFLNVEDKSLKNLEDKIKA